MKNPFAYYINTFKGLPKEVWMLSGVILVNRIASMVVPFLGVYMTQSLGFSIKDTGLVLSCFGLGAVAGSYLGGKLTDIYGFYKVQLISFLLTAPVYFILPQLQSLLSLSIGVFVLSLITDAFRPANSVALSYFSHNENMTKAFSLNRMAVNLGFSIGPALGGFLAGYSYDLLFYGNGIGALLAGLLFIYYFKKRSPQHALKSDHVNTSSESPYRNLPMVFFSLMCTLYAVCFFQLLSTLPLYYKEDQGLSEFEIGVILGYSGIFIVVFEMLIVQLAGKWMSIRSIIIWGALLCGIAFSVLNLSHSLIMLYGSITVLCVSEILAMPYLSTIYVNNSNEHNRGAYMGMYSLAFALAHIFSPYLGTYGIEHYGFDGLWWAVGGGSIITAIGFYLGMNKMQETP